MDSYIESTVLFGLALMPLAASVIGTMYLIAQILEITDKIIVSSYQDELEAVMHVEELTTVEELTPVEEIQTDIIPEITVPEIQVVEKVVVKDITGIGFVSIGIGLIALALAITTSIQRLARVKKYKIEAHKEIMTKPLATFSENQFIELEEKYNKED